MPERGRGQQAPRVIVCWMSSLRRPLAVLGVLTLTLASLLPPWEICWHEDGSVCVNPEPVPCCDEEESTPSPEPEPCSDCADLGTVEALKNDDQRRDSPGTADPLFLGPPPLSGCSSPSLPRASRVVHGPPEALPSGLLSPPLRC